jgi:hypothetical protein
MGRDSSVGIATGYGLEGPGIESVMTHTNCITVSKQPLVDISDTMLLTIRNSVKGKCKAIPLQALTGPEGSRRLRFPYFKTIATWRWQDCQPYAPAAFTPGKVPVLIVQEAGCAPRPVWSCAKNLALPGFFYLFLIIIPWVQSYMGHAAGGAVDEALRYKPEGRGIDSRWCQNFSLT